MQPSSPAPDDWNEHWSTYTDAVELNPAQAYRRKLIFETLGLRAAPRPLRVLELGSGQGDLSREIKTRFPEVELLGMDLSQTGIDIAQAKVPDGVFFQQDFTQPLKIPEKYRGWATHAVCSEVLEHVETPLEALKNVRACLAPGARLVITVPAGPMSAFDKHIGHRRHYTPEALRVLLSSAGMIVENVRGAGFPFFNLYRLMVVLRGQKLVSDVAVTGPLPASARAAMHAFSWLFRFNTAATLRGWQLVATAVEPESAARNGSARA